MQIFVKIHSGKTIVIDVEEKTLIKDIIPLVYEKGGLPDGYQRYVYSGKTLILDNTISDYNISKESTIHEIYKAIPVENKANQ